MPDPTAAAPADAAASAAAPDEELASEQTEGLGAIFAELGISLAVSTYQAGKLILVRNDGGVLNTHYRDSRKPMGIAAAPGQLAVGVAGEILFYSNVAENCRKLDPPGKHDACYVQRYGHLTGGIDIHEMAFGGDGQIWFINTRFSALCTINGSHSFAPVWKPPFVSAYAAEDRCHLNGLAMFAGKPRWVTAHGESDQAAGWREHKADGGVLIDLAANRVLSRGLSMPHSPRWYANQLWVCESGKGTLSKVDHDTGEVKPVFTFPGFTRGLDFAGPYAFVGLSKVRETAVFSGIPIAEKADERNCGIWIVNIVDGSLVGSLRFTSGVHEIFAVQALPGVRYPDLLNKEHPLALETYFLPPEVLRQVRTAPPQAKASAPADLPSGQSRAKSNPSGRNR